MASLRVRIGLVLGIVFLMTLKPSAVPAVMVVVVAAALGLLSGLIPVRRTANELATQDR